MEWSVVENFGILYLVLANFWKQIVEHFGTLYLILVEEFSFAISNKIKKSTMYQKYFREETSLWYNIYRKWNKGCEKKRVTWLLEIILKHFVSWSSIICSWKKIELFFMIVWENHFAQEEGVLLHNVLWTLPHNQDHLYDNAIFLRHGGISSLVGLVAIPFCLEFTAKVNKSRKVFSYSFNLQKKCTKSVQSLVLSHRQFLNGMKWYFVTKIVLTYCEKKLF